MAFTISPSVVVQERDFSLTVVELANYVGATAGYAQWGPADKPVLVTGGEADFINRFYKPNDITAVDQFTAIDFLGYSPKMYYTRVVGATALNAVSAGNTPVLVKNEDEFANTNLSGIQFLAKYPGSLGNGVIVDVADSTKFADWEFKTSFDYAPLANEYAIAVIDGSGNFTGEGKRKQTERLTVYGTASGGTKEGRAVALSGTVTGGTKQVENITFVGTASGAGNITVDGNNVAIASGDTATQVATKVASALAAVVATYDSATSNGAVVTVTFKVPGARTAIANVSGLAVTGTSAITTLGNANVALTLYGQTFNTVYGDTSAVVAGKFATALAANATVYDSAVATASTVNLVYKAYGVSAYPTTSQTSNGITAATSITQVGNANISLSVFGVTVAVNSGDKANVVANKIANALAADVTFVTTYESIAADRSSVVYSTKVVGKATSKTAPVDQSGLSFVVDVTSSGRLGSILEKYEIMTTDKTAKFPDGTTRYFVEALNKSSKYVYVGDKTIPLTAATNTMSGGVDDYTAKKVAAISVYSNAEQMDINYVWVAGDVIEQKAAIDVADTRRDCITFTSPMLSDVVNQKGNELTNITDWRSIELNRDSSYVFNTDNWALVYDQYNDVNRWIPTCGGTAGLLARTSADFDPWFSPAGHQRGRYKKYIRVAWSANKAQRDELYKIGVNSVVDFPAEGILLYGDKTSTSRPSAFNRINVRMAFIVAEKSVATFAKQFLFELNDAFTRAQFLNAVRPFLRNMQGRRAFEDFKVICDLRNNDGQVRAANKMVGQILIKPLYSINFVILDFAAVRPDVSFEEIETFI